MVEKQRKVYKIMLNDFNWVRPKRRPGDPPMDTGRPFGDPDAHYEWRLSSAHELAEADPKAFVDWQVEMGCNVIFQHAITHNGCAWYPSRWAPLTPGPGSEFLPKVMDLSHKAGLPFHSYMSIAIDAFVCGVHRDWLVPKSRYFGVGALAPESAWTDLLCRRLEELVRMYPIDGITFDQLFYGDSQTPVHLEPATFVRGPFKEIIGREMPERAEEVTPEETLQYWREVLARQFYRIRDVVKGVRPDCVIYFNVPFLEADPPLWRDHPMLAESDWLFAECTREDILNWLLAVKRPEQRVMSTFLGMPNNPGECDPEAWKGLYDKGLDFFGYAFPDPETRFPGPVYDEALQIVKEAFHSMPG